MEESNKWEKIAHQWERFSKTEAYKELMSYIDLQKDVNSTLAAGPIEIYKDVPTVDNKTMQQLEFEPEKLAYLLQRNVGLDTIRLYIEGFSIQ
jgi:hypothetical protein|nr:MAG TPA: hypothetical protein [Caudoviricetes sp.]